MKKLVAIILATSLTLGSLGTAQADWGRRDWGHQGYHRHGGGGGNWVGPAAVLAITGLAIGAAYSRPYVQVPPPQPVYVAPPPATASWYFCQSSGQYYPYTNACPEGWIAVPAR